MKEMDDIKTYYGEAPPKYARFIIEVFEAIDKRLTATEHDTFEHDARLEAIETVEGEALKPKPLSCCEGCADFPCNNYDKGDKERGLKHVGTGHASCYREKHVCGECAKPYQKVDTPDLLRCWHHDLPRHGKHIARLRSDEACPNFEAIQ